VRGSAALAALAAEVVAGGTDPHSAADRLLAQLWGSTGRLAR
jgi:LAO/AO transport system kinase